MAIELSSKSIVLLNSLGMPMIQIAWAWLFTRLPLSWFGGSPRIAPQSRSMEVLYEGLLRIRQWKHLLPDGGRWFVGGIPKKHLAARGRGYLEDFYRDTWRSELCHGAALCSCPIFMLWNPPWASAVMVAAFMAANLPCMLVQRYNRRRIAQLLCRPVAGQRRALARSARS